MLRPTALFLGVLAITAGVNAGDDRKTAKVADKGKAFFYENVLPRLADNGCPTCHAVGYVQPNVTQYDELLPYLAMGDAPEKTAVIRKIANLRAFAPDRPTHPGGQRCKSLDAEPCKTIIRWWMLEFGPRQQSDGNQE